MNNKYQKYIEYIVNDIELPYIKSLEPYGLRPEEYEMVLSKIFNQPVTIQGRYVYNNLGNLIYFENSDGGWFKQEYNNQGYEVYYENSYGNITDRR